MSAEAVLQGLFPQKHNGDTFPVWRPVPVHSVAQETDMVIYYFLLVFYFTENILNY